MLAVTWGTGQVLFDMFWFFLFVIQIWLLITVVVDLFRRHDLSGWVKALWVLALLILPFLGILLYLILYGREMPLRGPMDRHAPPRDTASKVENLHRLADLRDRGVITDEEFEEIKRRLLAS